MKDSMLKKQQPVFLVWIKKCPIPDKLGEGD